MNELYINLHDIRRIFPVIFRKRKRSAIHTAHNAIARVKSVKMTRASVQAMGLQVVEEAKDFTTTVRDRKRRSMIRMGDEAGDKSNNLQIPEKKSIKKSRLSVQISEDESFGSFKIQKTNSIETPTTDFGLLMKQTVNKLKQGLNYRDMSIFRYLNQTAQV